MSHNTIRTEATDPMCLGADEIRILLTDAPWSRFAVMGDSIAKGIGDPSPGYETSTWADRVAAGLKAARPDVSYLNTGRMGATSAQVLDEQLQTVLDFEPDLVHITFGGNDLWLPDADLDAMARNLETAFAAVQRSGAQISTIALADVFIDRRMQPMRDRISHLNDVTRGLAAKYDAVLVDLWEHPLRLRPDLMSADQIHFTMSGYAVVASEMVRALHDRLARAALPA
ncbi:SGNH/GDSL hydrolase family protein [Rhodococcus sp. UNC363MFTsu5.1]|uniref:SGNH/GDSL hydrolase family protein n=1 Tax=Rhodococcus sp. UNC363MFTsu5.1 TaxID=1449069 RepID=UPI0005690F74|nr:SGNH/GDSL hydrolase family protein [Rhodococcus sp. UNC363MFTsu5.1]